MSQTNSSIVLICPEEFDELPVLECNGFIWEEPEEHKDEREMLLGSRLEDELNKSIEKMREMEKSETPESILVANLLSSGGSLNGPQGEDQALSLSSPLGSKSEYIEDIEMPSLSASTSNSAVLVSLSPESPSSPAKHRSGFWNGASGASYSEPVKRKTTTDSSFRIHAAPSNKQEADMIDRIDELSKPAAMNVTTLVSLRENGSQSSESSFQSMTDFKDKSGNMTSSPLSTSCQPTALSFELLDMDNLNDSLLSSIIKASSPAKETPEGHSPPSALADYLKNDSGSMKDIQDKIKRLCNGLKEARRDSVTCGETADVTTFLSPSHRMTLGGVCSVLDMDEMNDSLLSSMHMAESPIVEPDFDFLLPTPLKEYKKKLLKKLDGDFGLEDDIASACAFPQLDHMLDETHGVANRSKSLNDLPKDLDKITVEETFSSLMNLLSNANSTFVAPAAPPVPSTSTCKSNLLKTALGNPKGKKATININSTFDKLEDFMENHTFCAKGSALANTANVTFDSKEVKVADTTFDLQGNQVDAACEKEEETNPTVDTEQGNEENGDGKLNVTFERGEYHISTLNETVNLMDAEGDVFKLILDSTPQKPSKAPPGAATTPKVGNRPESPAKRTVTKDPAQSFLRRMSLGMMRNAQNAADDKQQAALAGQAPNICAAVPGLKIVYGGQQSLTNQLRRLHNGPSGRANGPMRALPLAGMSVGSSTDNNTPDGLEGIKALDDNIPNETEFARQTPIVGRPRLPSFGSCSSIENERPSTPDLVPARGIMCSTPDLLRLGSSTSPRITSTPATKIGAFAGMDGPAPTPIIAPSSRIRFTTVNSTASLPEGQYQDNPTWEGLSKDSARGSKGSISTPAKSSGINVGPSKIVVKDDVILAATSEEQEKLREKSLLCDEKVDYTVVEDTNAERSVRAVVVDDLQDCPEVVSGKDIRVENVNSDLEVNASQQRFAAVDVIQEVDEQRQLSSCAGVAQKQLPSCAGAEQKQLSSCANNDLAYGNTEVIKGTMERDRIENNEVIENCNVTLDKPSGNDDAAKTELKSLEEKEVLDSKSHHPVIKMDEPSETEEIKCKGESNEVQFQPTVLKNAEQDRTKDSGLDQGNKVMQNSEVADQEIQLPSVVENYSDMKASEYEHSDTDGATASAQLPLHEDHGCSTRALIENNTEYKTKENKANVSVSPVDMENLVEEVGIVDQPTLNSTVILKVDNLKKKGGLRQSLAASKGNTNGAVRNPIAQKRNAEMRESKSGLSLKNKVEANKENATKTQSGSKSGCQPRMSTRSKNLNLREKLPTQRKSLAPSNASNKKLPEINNQKGDNSKENAILKGNNLLQKPQNTLTTTSRTRGQSRSPLVQKQQNVTTATSQVGTRSRSPLFKKAVNVSPLKQNGLKPPNTKGRGQTSEIAPANTATRLQPPIRSSLLQPQVNTKLPMAPRSNSGIASRSIPVVKSQLNKPMQGKQVPSKLSGIRPPSSRLPVLPTKTRHGVA